MNDASLSPSIRSWLSLCSSPTARTGMNGEWFHKALTDKADGRYGTVLFMLDKLNEYPELKKGYFIVLKSSLREQLVVIKTSAMDCSGEIRAKRCSSRIRNAWPTRRSSVIRTTAT